MIVEFIGTPGAGKSTLLPTVAQYLQEQGIHAWSVVEAARPAAQRTWMGNMVTQLVPQRWQRPLLWQIFHHFSTGHRWLFGLTHPRLIRQVLSSQLWRPVPVEARHHALHWFFNLTGNYHFFKTHAQPDEALLLDEGFVHRVVQMNASEVEEPDLQRIVAYLEQIPRPDLVIAVHAPWEVCLERIYRRGIWERYRTKSREEVGCYVQNAHRVVNLTVEQLRRRGWPLIEVENGDDHLPPPQAALRSQMAALPWLTPAIGKLAPQRGLESKSAPESKSMTGWAA